jgi:hypothetical protein
VLKTAGFLILIAILLVLPQVLGVFLSEVITIVGLYVLLGLGLFPATRKVIFVTGTAEGRLEYEAKRTFEPWRDKLEFQYTSDLSLEEVLQLVATLPPRSIFIYCNVFSDKTGRTFR